MTDDQQKKAAVLSWGRYPFSEMGGYLRTHKNLQVLPTSPPHDVTRVFCHFAQANIPAASARIICNQLDISVSDVNCLVPCGLGCLGPP